MARKRLRVSKLDGRRYRYPYPVYYRPPLRWITPSFTTKKVTHVARDFGPEILHAIHHNDLEFLQRILETRLRANSLITKLCMMDVGRDAAARRVSCPLIMASQKKDPTILRYMLEKGADPNYVEYTSHRPHGYSALHTAAKLGLLETTETLLLFKANPDAVDSRGDTPLLIAVGASNCALAKLLLSHGANPNARDKHGCTPLHVAASHGHLEMVNLLLSYGADLKFPNRNGAYPVHLAASAGHAHLIEALLGADTASTNAPCVLNGIRQLPLHLAAENGHVEVVSALLGFGADVNAKDSAGNTALHHVVLKPYQANTMRNMNHFFATAQTLLKAGIRVNDENNLGETAMVLAASNEFPKVAKLILSSAGGDLHIEPETLHQILHEQNILTSKNPNDSLTGKQTDHLADALPKQTLPSVGNAKSFPATTSDPHNRLEHKEQEVKTFSEASKPDSQAKNKESHPLKEIQSNVTNSPAQAPDVFAKRYPLPKSDLRNYQQFRQSPTIENEISTFTVTANKGAERMCILFDKNSPSGKKVTNAKKGSEDEFRPYIQKKSISTSSDLTKPTTRRLKSADENTTKEVDTKHEDHLGQSISSLEQKQNRSIAGKNDQQRDSSQISYPQTSDLGAEADESVEKQGRRLVTDNSDDEEESCWINYKVEKDNLLALDAYRDTQKHPAPSQRHYSKSPSGFFSEGGGLRGLRLRVTGEVPKAYTCKQKAAKRKAFFLAPPVGIESMGDYDRTHLSMSSLPEMGGLAWQKAMQRRSDWTEAPKPVFTKQRTPLSREFSPASSTGKLHPDGSRQPKSDYRITGLFAQPYKSFGKIETKTDAIEAALMDYESDDEEYESDDDDVEPLTTQWVSEMAEHHWHRSQPDLDEQFDSSIDDVVHANVLDESISSVEAEQIAGIISNGYLVGITEEENILEQRLIDTDSEEEETDEEMEDEDDEEKGEQQKEERKENDEAEQRKGADAVQRQVTSGRSGVGVLRVLHGYPSKGAPSSQGSTMVVSSVEPEIQRLTIDNIVLADSSASDDQEDDEISERTKAALPVQMENRDRSALRKGETSEHRKENDGEAPVNESIVEHQDKEVQEILRSANAHPNVSTNDAVSNFRQPLVKLDENEKTEDKENETDVVRHDRKEDLILKQSKVSPGAEEPQKPGSEERLMEGENVEEPKKKGKKGKKSSKKHNIAAKDSEEYENAVGEDIQAETVTSELPVKRKKKSKNKVTEKEPFLEEPESKPHIEENLVTKDTSQLQKSYDEDDINEEIANNIYAEEPARRQRKAEKTSRAESDDQTMPKQLRGKEDEIIYAYSEEPERRGKRRKEKSKVKESDERRDESQENIAENIDVEQPINVRAKPGGLQSDEDELNINDENNSQQVYDEEPGSRRKSSKQDKANEMAKGGIPDNMEGQENKPERPPQDEFTPDTVIKTNKKTKQKQKKLKDISLREGISGETQNEDAGKSQVDDELQKPLERKPSSRRKAVESQNEEVLPVESELSETHRVETGAVEGSEPTSKVGKKKTKKKIKGRIDSVTGQNLIEDFTGEPKHDHSTQAESLSDEQIDLSNATNEFGDKDSMSGVIKKQDGTSFENVSGSVGEESSFVEEPVKKSKKSKKITGKEGGTNNNWGINSAVHSEVWQEAMNEEPLASSETVYDAMHLTDEEKANAKKIAKKKSSVGRKQKNAEDETILVEDLSNDNLMVRGRPNSVDLAQTSHQQQISFPVKPVKETDIDDEFGDEEYDPKSSRIADSWEAQRVTDEKKADRRARVTMETSVDDIMDDLVESRDAMQSNDVKPIEAEVVTKWHKSRETSVDDDLDDFLSCTEAAEKSGSESELKVERSLETNVDEYNEEPFARRLTPKSNEASMDMEKSRPLIIREAVESKASKVTNVDEYQVVPTPFGVEMKLKQPDSRFEHTEDTEGTGVPEDSEQLEAAESQKRKNVKKGKKKKSKLAQEEENYGGQSEMQESQNAEENEMIDSEEKAGISRKKRKKKTKAAEEEFNKVTYAETGADEDVQKLKQKRKTQKQISDKVLKEEVEDNLEGASEQAKMRKKKAAVSAYEDNNLDEEVNNFNEEEDINMDNDDDYDDDDDVRLYPQRREHIIDAFIREARIDEDEENQDDEETTEVKESDHGETSKADDLDDNSDLDEDSDLDDKDQQNIQRQQKIKIKRFGEDSSLSEDNDEIIPENTLRTFNIGIDSQKKVHEKSVTKNVKPEKELNSGEDVGEMKRRKKTRKPVGETAYSETGIDEDLDNIKRQDNGHKVKPQKVAKGEINTDGIRIYPQKQEQVRGPAVRETGIDDNMESQDDEELEDVQGNDQRKTGIGEDLDDKGRPKILREKIQIKRFGEDSSPSEDSDEITPQNALKTFNVGSDSQKKVQEKSGTKKEKPEKEMDNDEDFGEIRRRKKTRKPVGEAAYIETGVDEDLDNIKKQEKVHKVKANKVAEGGKNKDHVRIQPQKQENVRGPAVRDTGIDDDIESQDDEEFEDVQEIDQRQTDDDDEGQHKIQREKIKIKRFGENSSSGEDNDEITPQNALRTFNIGSDSQKKGQVKSVTKKEKPEREMDSDDDFSEIKRGKKIRKPVGEAAYIETGIDEDLDNIKRQENGHEVKPKKVAEGEINTDDIRIYPQKQEPVRGAAMRETGIDDDIESQDDEELEDVQGSDQRKTGIGEDLDDKGRPKILREKIQIKRFGEDSSPSEDSKEIIKKIQLKRFGEDSSPSEDNEEIIPQNALKTFNVGTDSQKRVHEKPGTKKEKPEKEMDNDEDFGEIRRRKKTRKPVGEAAYTETGVDEDLDNIKKQENVHKVKANNVAEGGKNKDHVRIHPQKQENVRGPAMRKTGIDEETESQDEEELEDVQESYQRQNDSDDEGRHKIQREKIKIKRFGEDSSPSEDSEEKAPQNALRTFNIGSDSQKKVHEKSGTKKEKPEKEIDSDEDFGEIRRRKKTRKPAGEAAYKETGIDEDLDNIKRQENGHKVKPQKVAEGEINTDDIRIYPQKQEQVRGAAVRETGIDDDIESQDEEELEDVQESDQRQTAIGEGFDDKGRPKISREKIQIKRFGEDSSLSEDSEEIIPQNALKTFNVGTDSKKKVQEKSGTKQEKPEKEIDSDEDFGEIRRRKKTRKPVGEAAYRETGIEEDLDDINSYERDETEKDRGHNKPSKDEVLDDAHKHDKQSRHPIKISRFKEDSTLSDDDDMTHDAKSTAKSFKIGNDKKVKTEKTLVNKTSKPTPDTEIDIDEEYDEIRRRQKTRKQAAKPAYVETGIDDDLDDEPTYKEKEETNLDQLSDYEDQLSESEESDEHHTRVTAKVESLLSKKKQFDEQEFDLSEENKAQTRNIASFMGTDDDSRYRNSIRSPATNSDAFEIDESEELGGSFSRKQAGRVSRGRAKKGPRNWRTEETEITETEVTSEQDRKNRQSALSDKANEETKRKSLQQTPPSQGLDLDESIRRKRRMEMTEDITTTIKTSPIPDSSLSPSGTENSSYSLSSPPSRHPPKKRDIQPMNISAPLLQETTFDVEPSPATKPALDISLPEVSRSKTDPSTRNSMDPSLLRKSTPMERTFQQRAQRQHSAESLNRHRPRSHVNDFEVRKSNSDASLTRRKRSSIRSRSAGHLNVRTHYNGLYRTQTEQKMRPTSFKQTNKTLQEAALETITTSSRNEPRWLKNMDDLETIVYTRGVYRPQPVYWRGANRGTGANDESRMSALQVPEHHGLNESTEDAGNRTAEESLDKSKLNGNADFDLNTSLPAKLSLSKDGDELEQRNSAFAAYNKRVTIHEDQRQPQFYGRRRGHGHGHGRRPRTRPSREEPYKAPQITEPNAVDFNKYGIVAQLWMEQVDMKTVLKSRTMYLTIMPAGAQLPDEIMKSMKHVQAGEDQSAPAQWIIARGRTIRRQKRHMDGHRMSESFFLSGADSDPDLSRSGYPMSPGKQSLLFFKVGGRWPDLAWALFEGIHTDAATLRMIKDIELKNPGRMTDQIQDMMNRWWTQKGQAATIEELRRSLELINLPFVQDETLNVTMANNFFSTSDLENKLAVEEVDAGDPEVSRMAHEYNLHSHNASFVAEHRRSPQSAQPFSSDALLRQMQQKGLLTKSQPSLRNSLLKPEDNWVSSIGRSNSRDGSFIRHQARNESLRLFSSQDSLNAENVGDDNKRKSFTIVQPKTPKNKKFRHESNM